MKIVIDTNVLASAMFFGGRCGILSLDYYVRKELIRMTAAAIQRITNVAIDLPDEAEGAVINFMVSYKKPELDETDVSYRIGAGEGEFVVPDDFDAGQEEIYAEMERFALS